MILTAGLGKRMQPLTNKKPKPLLEIGGITLLERAINLLINHGVKEISVNIHHLGDQIEKYISDLKSEVKISEGSNSNRVFSLPKKEAKGSPFYDSFIYARDKYGPEKYFVWYNKWYSTDDASGDLASGVKDRVFFATNKTSLTSASRETLRKQATYLRKNKKLPPIYIINAIIFTYNSKD